MLPQTTRSLEIGPWGLPPLSTRPSGQPKRLSRQRGLIFDLDDTLYPRERFIRSGFAAVANDLQRRHGVAAGLVFKILSRSFTQGATGREFQVVCAELGLPLREVPYMVRVFRAHKPSLWLPHESSETLRKLRVEGWKLGILTNGLPAVQAAKVAALALAPMVDTVVYAEAIVNGGKPKEEAFQAVLDRLDLPAERCVMVGDDPNADIAGARVAGLRSMRLARPGVTVMPGAEADLVISSIADVPKLAGGLLELVTLDAA